MLQKDILNEQLNSIYIIEAVNNDLNKIKTNAKKIGTSFKSSNILRIYKSTEFLKNMSDEELDIYAQKKFRVEYQKSKKLINTRIKKSSTRIKNLLIVFFGGLIAIKKNAKDPDVQFEVDKAIKRTKKSLKTINLHTKKNGLSTLGAALVIQQLVLSVLFITGTLLVNGQFAIFGACVVASLSLLIMAFVDAKKTKSKVID